MIFAIGWLIMEPDDLQLAAAGVILAACNFARCENKKFRDELIEAVKVFRMEEREENDN